MVGANRIKLQNGNLVGSITPLFGEVAAVEGTNVHIIQNDKQVAQVQADVNGAFSVADLEPGIYDFVAAGPTGIAAVSFQAIDAEGQISADSDEIPVSIMPSAAPALAASPIEPAAAAAALPFQDIVSADIPFEASSLDVCTTCGNDAGFVGQQVSFAGQEVFDQGYETAPIEFASESVSNGGACGASCGSAGDFSGFSSCNTCNAGGATRGGGLFGGGRLAGGGSTGLRRLLLLGGIAGAAVAISVSDDDSATPTLTN